MARVIIDPLSRVYGHLSADLEVQNGIIVSAKIKGDMFRGLELILKGRTPFDAVMISQRICGVCPVSHAAASCKAVESASGGIIPPENGVLLRNLILAASYLQSHITHFYHLALMDYAYIKALLKYSGRDEKMNLLKEMASKDLQNENRRSSMLAPFYHGYDPALLIKNSDLNLKLMNGYLKAFEIRMKCQKMAAVFAGKIPHAASVLPGGVTQSPDSAGLNEYRSLLSEVSRFVKEIYFDDALSLFKYFPEYTATGGFDKFLSYGAFENEYRNYRLFNGGVIFSGNHEQVDLKKITEDVKSSRYASKSGLNPSSGETIPVGEKIEAYSWIKAPRYKQFPFETGPLARMMIGAERGTPETKKSSDNIFRKTGQDMKKLNSVMGRHLCRAAEAAIISDAAVVWLDQVKSGAPAFTDFKPAQKGEGAGILDAPRGALGHWISISDYRIENYQCVTPSAWNIGPRDDRDMPGVIESVLTGMKVADIKNPVEPSRLIRSFDPCVSCAVHAIEKM